MKIPPSVRTALQAIEDRGHATLPQLIANDVDGRSKQSWYTRMWRAKEMGLVESSGGPGGCHAATYTITDLGREVLDSRRVRAGEPGISMVAYAMKHQPTSVWALGAAA